MRHSFFTFVARLIHLIDNREGYPRPVKIVVTVDADGEVRSQVLGRPKPPGEAGGGKVVFPVVKAETKEEET